MPSAITHYLQSGRVINKLVSDGININIDKDSFLWGAQGPDFLLSHRCLPFQKGESIKKIGAKIQDDNLENLINYIKAFLYKNTPGELGLSYIMGFICHSVLDRIAFPFISYGAENLSRIEKDITKNICRNNIKSNLDVIILRYEKQMLTTEINLNSLLPNNDKVKDFMVTFFYDIIYNHYDSSITVGKIIEAINDFKKFFALMNDSTGKKKDFVKFLESFTNKGAFMSSYMRDVTEDDTYDYANISNSQWQWPEDTGEIHTDSFFDLYEESIIDSSDLIKGLIVDYIS